jgi:hypothetical protein
MQDREANLRESRRRSVSFERRCDLAGAQYVLWTRNSLRKAAHASRRSFQSRAMVKCFGGHRNE